MENKRVKILSVGIGGYPSIYIQELLRREMTDFEIVGAVDPRPDASGIGAMLRERNIPIYSDMEDFYSKNDADLAIIMTPIHLHTRQTLCALAHGSNVLCEKPLSGVSADAAVIEDAARKAGKFVMIGYQWSFSDAINELKNDILTGALGKPISLKTIVLWPRNLGYFARGGGWAGKLRASDGTVINDSVAANATAHYLHNILYVCGEVGKAAEASCVRADLLRVNNIENFDNCAISFKLDNGADCLFLATHSSKEHINPVFEYKFEGATVKYNGDDDEIIAYFESGDIKNYGSPNTDASIRKVDLAIGGCNNPDYKPLCSPFTAAAHTRLIEKLTETHVYNANSALIKEQIFSGNTQLYLEALGEVYLECYDKEIMPSDIPRYKELLKNDD